MLVLSAVAAVRANSYAQRLKLRLAVIHGNTKQDLIEDGRTSPPPEGSAGYIHPSRSRTSASQSGTLRPHPLLAPQCRCVCMCARLCVCMYTGVFQSMAMNLVGDVNGHIAIIVVSGWTHRLAASTSHGSSAPTPVPTGQSD